MNIDEKKWEKAKFEELRQFTEKFQPFDWDSVKKDFRLKFSGKNDLIISFYRYFKVLCELGKHLSISRSVIVDFGIFPGILPKIVQEIFPEKDIKYYGIGLGFTPEFIKYMRGIGVDLTETELDPFYVKPKQIKKIDYTQADFVLFLDIIEHLVNPIYALDSANRCLKKDGILILTTDNITSKEKFISIFMGKTPLLHPLLTHMFFIGDWRPHFREYSKDDLIWLLNHSGFKIEKHEYFNNRQAEYQLINGKLLRKKEPASKYFGGNLFKRFRYYAWRTGTNLLMWFMALFPHFRNHQIIVAKKIREISEIEGKRPELQDTIEGWKNTREKYLGY